MRVKHYVKKFKKVIASHVKGTGLLPSIVMAHAIYEAAGDDNRLIGKSPLAIEHNNDLRVVADKTWQGEKVLLPVRHFTRHKELVPERWFKVYSDSKQSIEDRIKMLTGRVEKWPRAILHHDTVKSQAAILELLAGFGDKHYATRIIGIINKFKLFRLDRQWWIQSTITNSLVSSAVFYALVRWDDWVPWRQ